MAEASDLYKTGAYLSENPGWHVADSLWKATQVLRVLEPKLPATICDVGCGVGEVLSRLHSSLPGAQLVGYEVAPDAFQLAQSRATDRLSYRLSDPIDDSDVFDVMLVLDVLEHVPDPVDFLARLRFKAERTVLHIPLDISVQSVLRPQKLLHLRRALGHIHHFTPETALATVEDAGYRIDRVVYTSPFRDLPPRSTKARIARVGRKSLPRGIVVRLLGGYSLLVSAINDASPRDMSASF